MVRRWDQRLYPPSSNPWIEDALAQNDPNPFVRFRKAFHSWHLATGHGMSDEEYIGRVRDLDGRVAAVDGRGFTVTPFTFHGSEHEAKAGLRTEHEAKATLWIKDETANVSGSHKARHLMGIAVWIEIVEELGLLSKQDRPPLAIASCGNAALAAAVVAAAMGRELRVFVPENADPVVLARIQELGARIQPCPRVKEKDGDPCIRSFHRALDEGALPFGCQGPENGMTIEGGLTLGYEMAQILAETPTEKFPHHLMVQVGGGALGSSVFQSLMEALCFSPGAAEDGALPHLHTVQTTSAYPLRRAWEGFALRVARRLDEKPAGDRDTAELLAHPTSRTVVLQELEYAARHRGEFMWPWEETPHSVATGILDDECYDWWALLRGMVLSGGIPAVADESTLRRANDLAKQLTPIPVSATGSAGLAGWMSLLKQGLIESSETAAVLFTGVER